MKETLKNLKKVYKYGKKYKKALIYQIICCIIFITFNIILPIITSKQLVYLTDNLFKQLFIATVMVLVINVITHLFRVLLRRNTQIFFRGTTRDLQVALGKEILKILDDAKDCLPNNLLLNPMRNVDTVRSKLIENYFIDYDQKFFDKKFYDIMLLTRGKDNLTLPQIKYGKTNLEFFCNDFCNFLQEERKKFGKILEINDSQEIKLYLKELDELLNRSKNAG